MLRAVVLTGASGQVVGCWGELDETARQGLRETARRRLDGHETWEACDWLVRHYGDVLFRASEFSGLVADHVAAALDVVESGEGFDAFYAFLGGVRARGSQSRDSRRRQARELMGLAPGMTDYAVRTIGRDVPPVEVWESWNQEFMQALSKRWPMVWVMWSLAVQRRQAPHWDDLVGGVPDGREAGFWRWYRDEWLRISGDGGSPRRSRLARGVHHQRLSDVGGVVAYVTREVGKGHQTAFVDPAVRPSQWYGYRNRTAALAAASARSWEVEVDVDAEALVLVSEWVGVPMPEVDVGLDVGPVRMPRTLWHGAAACALVLGDWGSLAAVVARRDETDDDLWRMLAEGSAVACGGSRTPPTVPAPAGRAAPAAPGVAASPLASL